jgi:branched-chain amino acid transport system permease protein
LLAQQIINGLMVGGIYVLIAVAFTLTIGVINFLNFSIPAIFMVSGMVAWGFMEAGWHWSAALPCALIAGGLASLIVERFTYRWLKGSSHFVPLVSSMAFLILFENLVLVHWGSDMQLFQSPFPDANIRLSGVIISVPQLVSLVAAVLLVFGLSKLLKGTNVGRGLRTIAESPDTAEMLGVDVDRVVPIVFLISGLFTALGGLLFALNYLQVSPFMGEEVALKGISAMVIGGMGNIWGAIIGGLLIGVTEVLSITFFGADFVDIAVYGLLLLLLFVRPTGLLGGSAIGKGKL